MTERERISKLLKEYGFIAKKSFGQNFLINEGIIKRIVTNIHPEEFSSTIEIGPGLASLTLPLREKTDNLIIVDADRDMITILKDIFKDDEKIKIIQSDFLRFDPDLYTKKEDRLFVGNLPYNITSELLEYFLLKSFKRAGVMVQKEVADKLDYKAGKKENTALGAFIKASGNLKLLTYVDRSCFDPSPKVNSAFITIDIKEEQDFSLYKIFKAMFKDPNKTILNCLRQFKIYDNAIKYLQDNKIEELSFRARQLEASRLLELSKIIKEKM